MPNISNKSLVYLLAISLFLNFELFAADKIKVCYISSSIGHVLPRANDFNQEWKGYKFAVSKYPFMEFLTQEVTNKSGILEGVLWAKNQNCLVVVGLVTSHDAIIAAPELIKNDLFGISSTATTTKINQWASNIKSFAVSTKSYVEDMRKNIGNKKIVIIGEKGSVFSAGFKEFSEHYFTNALYVEQIGTESKKLILDAEIVLFANYPIEALPWLSLIELKGKNIFGNQSWNEVHVFSQLPQVRQIWSKIKILSPFDIKKAQDSEYAKAYWDTYKIFPDHDSYYDYEVVGFIASCIRRKSRVDKMQVYKCLREKKEFRGVTGDYQFNPGDTSPKRKQSVFQLDKISRSEN